MDHETGRAVREAVVAAQEALRVRDLSAAERAIDAALALLTPAPALLVRADDGPVVLTFPTIGVGGTEWRLRLAQVAEWQALFPGLDVAQECRHALAWIRASPERRKTTRGMPKFLTGWFTRSVDRRGSSGGPAATAAPGAKAKITAALERASAEFLES